MNSLNCVMCGEKFESKRSDTKYCSEKCRTRAETIARVEKKRQNRKVQIKKCEFCESEFFPHIRNPHQIYCSQSCLDKAMYEKAKENPDYKEKKKMYDIKYREENRESKRERDLKYKDNLRFGGNGSKAMERDGYKCMECGKNNRKALIVHHKDHSGSSDKPNNDLSNLVTLCRSCHMNHHSSKDPNHIMYHKRKIRN